MPAEAPLKLAQTLLQSYDVPGGLRKKMRTWMLSWQLDAGNGRRLSSGKRLVQPGIENAISSTAHPASGRRARLIARSASVPAAGLKQVRKGR
jgi:hypothetical protein